MQEEITQGAVSLSVEAGKMTADLLQKALKKVLEEMQKKPSQRTLRQGKQTLHQLKQHGASLTNIEITEQNIKAFSAVAKKYDIDYALKKDPHTEPPHYYVFFKAKDKDQLQPAFKEFTAMTLGREKRPTIRERLAQAQEQSRTKHRSRLRHCTAAACYPEHLPAIYKFACFCLFYTIRKNLIEERRHGIMSIPPYRLFCVKFPDGCRKPQKYFLLPHKFFFLRSRYS